MKSTFIFFILCVFTYACAQTSNSSNSAVQSVVAYQSIIPSGMTLETRFNPPQGYTRIDAKLNSFTNYLRQLPLKPHGSKVRMYNGSIKHNNNVYDAVVDMPIGKRDLHQCADAVMRLRAEYLWKQKRYDEIHFNFTNGFQVDYSEWMKGKRIVVKENKTYWSAIGTPSNTYQDFWKYMEIIFSYAGTLSLSKELKVIQIKEILPGDVFIYGGSPGHAVIVVDVAVNEKGEKKFLLAQSYMPAQETQILQNPNNDSPWYSTDFEYRLETPEWSFDRSELKRFAQLNK